MKAIAIGLLVLFGSLICAGDMEACGGRRAARREARQGRRMDRQGRRMDRRSSGTVFEVRQVTRLRVRGGCR